MPKNVSGAYIMNKANGDDYCRNSIAKYMNNVLITFDILDKGDDTPANLKLLGVHLLFDGNMDLIRKARLLTD